MAKKHAQNKTALTLADFEKDGYLFQEKINGNKFIVSNVFLKDYNKLFENQTINSSPRYQRPYTYNDNDGSGGADWQKGLIAAFINGEFIQPIHLRFRTKLKTDYSESKDYYILEVLDGGHRTRTICNFIAGKLQTPSDFSVTIDGVIYQCSGMYFNELDEVVREYILSTELTICVHYNLSNDAAGERFRTLNNLHNMSRQEKRSSFYKHIAQIVRKIGAVDLSQYKIFSSITQTKSTTTLNYISVSLESDSRATDEFVASLFHIFSNMRKGDINGYDKPNNNALDAMYKSDASEDFDISKSFYNDSTEVYKRVNAVLEFMDKMIVDNIESNTPHCGRGRFTKSSMYKLALFFDWILSKYPKATINKFNPEVFWNKLYHTINDINMKHIEYQTYKIENDKVVIDKEGDDDKKIIPSSWKVWGTGDRLDDMQYILLHLMVKFDIADWGFTKAKKDNLREFTNEQKEQLYKEQNGICRRTGKPLSEIQYAADHIIPHSYGAPTIVENGQLIDKEVNGNKSSGVTIDDVKLVCNRMGYKKVKSLIDMFETTTSELLPEDIEMVVKKVFKV